VVHVAELVVVVWFAASVVAVWALGVLIRLGRRSWTSTRDVSPPHAVHEHPASGVPALRDRSRAI